MSPDRLPSHHFLNPRHLRLDPLQPCDGLLELGDAMAAYCKAWRVISMWARAPARS